MGTLATPPGSTLPATQPPSPNTQGDMGVKFRRMLATALTGPGVLRPAFTLLRHSAPVLKVGKRVVLSRHHDVVEVLERDHDFTIKEVNGDSIDRINGPFILNMDRGPGSDYDRDHAELRAAARREDGERIRELARAWAAEIVAAGAAEGGLEVVQGLTREIPARLVAVYFGVPGPDRDSQVRWLRNLFQDAFVNPTDDPFVREAALRSFQELRAWILPEIARRRAEGVAGAEDVMGRLIAVQSPEKPWADDDWVRRNVAGLIVGAVDTVSRFSVLALDELMRRPQELAGAQRAARAGDVDAVRQFAWEAVRFNPHTPLMGRGCPRDTVIRRGTPNEKHIPAGSSMVLGVLSAMFDPEAFPDPGSFRIDRPIDGYLHFGWGLHQCFGLQINKLVIPEILAALLRQPNLRRAPGTDGHVAHDGPFPDRWVLQFG